MAYCRYISFCSFSVVQKSFNMTGLLIKQIESLGMRINIAFVGDKLMKTVHYLENQSSSVRSGSNSYLLFHYKPSRLTSLYKYTSITLQRIVGERKRRENGGGRDWEGKPC